MEEKAFISLVPGATLPSILGGYFTKRQLATELKVSPRTIDRWHLLRQGPPRTEIGRAILYRRDSVVAWLESRERKAVRR